MWCARKRGGEEHDPVRAETAARPASTTPAAGADDAKAALRGPAAALHSADVVARGKM